MSRLASTPLVLFLLACTGAFPLGASDNRAACARYVEHMNGLSECLGLVYDASNLCQEVDAAPVDMAPFYDCLVEHSSCDGGVAKLDLDACQAPVMELAASTPPD